VYFAVKIIFFLIKDKAKKKRLII